jgi:hypothetical protein
MILLALLAACCGSGTFDVSTNVSSATLRGAGLAPGDTVTREECEDVCASQAEGTVTEVVRCKLTIDPGKDWGELGDPKAAGTFVGHVTCSGNADICPSDVYPARISR